MISHHRNQFENNTCISATRESATRIKFTEKKWNLPNKIFGFLHKNFLLKSQLRIKRNKTQNPRAYDVVCDRRNCWEQKIPRTATCHRWSSEQPLQKCFWRISARNCSCDRLSDSYVKIYMVTNNVPRLKDVPLFSSSPFSITGQCSFRPLKRKIWKRRAKCLERVNISTHSVL